METKIATLMAVYRGDDATALATALESVIRQEFAESVQSRLYIAVDGPVPSTIKEVLSKNEKHIYRILWLEQNGGLATALNALIQILGDESYVFRMDADDVSHYSRYQTQLNYFRQHPDIDILGTDIIEIVGNNGVQRRVSFCRGPDDALDKLCWRVPVAHPTVCFKREVLDRVGGYPLNGANEDIALWIRCAQEGFKFDNVNEALYNFTVTNNFWRRRSFNKAVSELRCYISGIWTIHGFTWKYLLPILRFMLRISPHWVSRLMYKLPIRRLAQVK